MQRQKTKKKKIQNSRKKHRIEYDSYQPNNPLTEYYQRVCGINNSGKKD